MNIAVIAGWVARGVSILLSLLNTRLLVNLVGAEGLAAQSIIFSLTAWLTLLNLGVPTSVQNLISKCRAEGRSYDRLKDTAYSALAVLFVVLLPVVLGAGVLVKQWLLANYIFVKVYPVLAACVLIFLSGLGLLFNQILYAEHRGLWPNLYPAINAVGVSCCLLLLNWLDIHDFSIVLIFFFLPTLLVFSIGAVQVKAFRSWCFDYGLLHEIWGGSKGFLLFASLAACTLAVDYFVMSLLLQAGDIARYNLVSRLFGSIMTIYGILLATAWSSVSELIYGKNFTAARNRLGSILGQGMLLGVAGGAVLTYAMAWLVSILGGGAIGDIPLALSLLFFAYILIRIWCDAFAMGLLCVGKTAPINLYIPFQAAISVIGQYYLCSLFGLKGIVLGLIISFLLTAAWVLPWQFFKLTRRIA